MYDSPTDQMCDGSFDSLSSSNSSGVSQCIKDTETGGSIVKIGKCVPILTNGTIFTINSENTINQETYSNLDCTGSPSKSIVINNNDNECFAFCQSNSELIYYSVNLISTIDLPDSIATAYYSGECQPENWIDSWQYIGYITTYKCSYNFEILYYTLSCNATTYTMSTYNDPQCLQNETQTGTYPLVSLCASLINNNNNNNNNNLNSFKFCNQ